MNLKKVNDSAIQGTFKVGNLNDYINIINKTNAFENSEVSVEDFEDLEGEYADEKLSYKVMSKKDDKAIKTIRVNNKQVINIY